MTDPDEREQQYRDWCSVWHLDPEDVESMVQYEDTFSH